MLDPMHASTLLTDCLKRELRAQRLSYSELAQRLGLSTATVKRMFAQRNFDLQRLDAICETLGLDFAALAQGLACEDKLVSQLEWAQEADIVGNDRLFIVAVCALNLMSFEEIVAIYRIELAECVHNLLRLDRMGFLRLLPNNRYRLLVSRTFQWIPDGPILRYFRSQAGDYLARPFDGPGETVRVVNVRISSLARSLLLERIETLVREYSAQHNADAALPLDQRYPMSLLVAVRGWEPDFMRRLRRVTPGAVVNACSTTGPAGLRNRQPDSRSPAGTRSWPAPP
jgi:transcriptional regulator with XRE-family HTH domain